MDKFWALIRSDPDCRTNKALQGVLADVYAALVASDGREDAEAVMAMVGAIGEALGCVVGVSEDPGDVLYVITKLHKAFDDRSGASVYVRLDPFLVGRPSSPERPPSDAARDYDKLLMDYGVVEPMKGAALACAAAFGSYVQSPTSGELLGSLVVRSYDLLSAAARYWYEWRVIGEHA